MFYLGINIFGKTSKELLLQLNSPCDYEDVSSEQLEELLSQVTLKGVNLSYSCRTIRLQNPQILDFTGLSHLMASSSGIK